MQTSRLHKQNINLLSSLQMSLDFMREKFSYNWDLERKNYDLISDMEEKYYAKIRQPRCRNGG